MVKCSLERGAQILGDVEHLGEVGDAAHIEPVPELLRAHLRLALRHDAGRDQRLAELGARQADQRRLFGRLRGRATRARAVGGEVE